jgi:hypothetical protein
LKLFIFDYFLQLFFIHPTIIKYAIIKIHDEEKIKCNLF